MNRNDLTRQIIGAAIEVHKLRGAGLLESAYEECLCHELAIRGIHSEKQKPMRLVYKGTKLECGFRLDLLVEGQVIVELTIHEANLPTYLRLSGHPSGLLINFNVSVLKDGVRRFIMPPQTKQAVLNTEIAESTSEEAPHTSCLRKEFAY